MPESDPLHDDLEEITRLEEKISALETDLRQKKEIILAQHTKLEAFFETSIDAVVQMDFDGYITGWNQQAEIIFGWKAEEILEQTLEETIVPERLLESRDTEETNHAMLAAALENLDDRSKDIVTRRWLIEPKATLHELADEYGVSAERIRQIESNAFKNIKGAFAA